MSDFDPAKSRRILLALTLPGLDFQPWRQSPTRIAFHVQRCVNALADCYWVGLADIARPKLTAILRWLDGQLPPHRGVWSRHSDDWNSAWFHHRCWWEAVALARWLVNNDPATADFAKAVDAEQDALAHVPSEVKPYLSHHQAESLPDVLPLALSAGRPAVGLSFYRASTARDLEIGVGPALKFGEWACDHLAGGGARDAEFVARGEAMLREALPSYFQYVPHRGEATLWLKAIYFDSGVTRTAEETILRAYDLMPDVPRPDFLPR